MVRAILLALGAYGVYKLFQKNPNLLDQVSQSVSGSTGMTGDRSRSSTDTSRQFV